MSEQVQPLPPTLRLQINTTGAWRNVIDFASHQSRRIEQAAVDLFGHDERVTLRVVEADSNNRKPPLMHWSKATGWRVWGERHAAQA